MATVYSKIYILPGNISQAEAAFNQAQISIANSEAKEQARGGCAKKAARGRVHRRQLSILVRS